MSSQSTVNAVSLSAERLPHPPAPFACGFLTSDMNKYLIKIPQNHLSSESPPYRKIFSETKEWDSLVSLISNIIRLSMATQGFLFCYDWHGKTLTRSGTVNIYCTFYNVSLKSASMHVRLTLWVAFHLYGMLSIHRILCVCMQLIISLHHFVLKKIQNCCM